MHQEPRDRLLGRWGRLVTRYPRLTLLICGGLAVASVLTAVLGIRINPDRNALISKDLPWAARYAAYRADFPHWDDVIVCLEGAPDDPSIDEAAAQLATSLEASPLVSSAVAGFAVDRTGPRLWKVAPPEVFDATLADLSEGRRIIAAPTAASALLTMLQQPEEAGPVDEDALNRMLTPYIDAVGGHPPVFDLLGPLRTEHCRSAVRIP